MAARIIDGKAIAARVREGVKRETEEFVIASGVRPKIVFILVGNDPGSEVYVRNKGITATEMGFENETIRMEASTPESVLLERIDMINRDATIHGLLVQLPLPKQISEERVIEAIDPAKDVDGFHPTNVGRLMIGKGRFFAPATPSGIVEMLRQEGIEISGKHAVVVGRSNIVGKPLAILLAQKGPNTNAIVTLAHSAAGDTLAHYTRQADLLIAAVGVAGLITADMVKPGAVVIDVGTNRIDDASRKSGYRTVGDVDFAGVSEVASAITPVPGGVGPMTIAMLLKNTLQAAKQSAEAAQTGTAQ